MEELKFSTREDFKEIEFTVITFSVLTIVHIIIFVVAVILPAEPDQWGILLSVLGLCYPIVSICLGVEYMKRLKVNTQIQAIKFMEI